MNPRNPQGKGGVGVGIEQLAFREVLTIDRQDFTTDESFHIREPGVHMPIDGPGELLSAFVIADSDQFNVYVDIDGETIISDTYAEVKSISAELPRIDAYTDGSDEVFSVTDYEFLTTVDVVIEPQQSITFRRQRAEIDLFRGELFRL